MTTLGIDPGFSGAFALYDHPSGFVEILDMPTYMVTVGKTKRSRVSEYDLLQRVKHFKKYGIDVVLLELVAARPKQSGMFAFGELYGMIKMACSVEQLPVEFVGPQIWKGVLKVPGGRNADDGQIIQRADMLAPYAAPMWRGPKGGRMVDRAEAFMLAYYGETMKLGQSHGHSPASV